MDRRTIWAILLMMIIAVAPQFFLKKPVAPTARGGEAGTQVRQADSLADTARIPLASRASDSLLQRRSVDSAAATAPLTRPPASAPTDTVRVTSPLYTYGISTRGGRLVEATPSRYRSMDPSDSGRRAQILSRDSRLLSHRLVVGRDTIPLDDWPFTVSAETLDVKSPTLLRLSATRNGIKLDMTYTFHPDDYRIDVAGRVSGIGPNGGQLLV